MEDKKACTSRRDFLKIAGTTAPVAVAAVAVGADGAEASEAKADTAHGLTKTAHVRKYLDSARF